jgi:capsular polysaccharide biosynthesis protein
VVTALDALRRSDPDAETRLAGRDRARLDGCEQVVRRLQADKELVPHWSVADAARLMWAVTSQRVWEDLVLDQGWSTQRYAHHLTQLLERSLLSG